MSSIGLYADKELTLPIPKRLLGEKLVWALNFGHLDAGDDKEFIFFLENQSLGAIEELEIVVNPLNRDDIVVEVLDGSVPTLSPTGIHEFKVRWFIPRAAKAGKCQANMSITGMITEE